MEEDIAEERFLYWVSRGKQSTTSHDAVDGNTHTHSLSGLLCSYFLMKSVYCGEKVP